MQISQSNVPFLVCQTIPVGDEHFCHLKLSFVPINLRSWSPRDWKVLVPFGGAPLRNLEGLLHPIRARQIEKRLLFLQNGIIKSIYLHIIVPKSTFELRHSSVSRRRKFHFRARVNNNLKYERHGYLLQLNRWDNQVLWTYSPNLWLTVTAFQDSLICY